MVRKIKEEENEDELFDEVDEEEGLPELPEENPMQVERTNKFARKERRVPEDRFKAFHSPQIDGIRDMNTGKVIYQGDLWQILAVILSSLNRIEENLG